MHLSYEGPNIHTGTITSTEPLTVAINGDRRAKTRAVRGEPVSCTIFDHGPNHGYTPAIGDHVTLLIEDDSPPAILGKIHFPVGLTTAQAAGHHDA